VDLSEGNSLRRSISLPLLTLYGLGTTIGAGIFILTGKVAGEAGAFAPLAFLVASLLAGFAALSFAEMAARFPESGGEAVYIKEGLGSDRLAVLTGLLVILAGLVSTATIIVGFSGYFSELIALPSLASKIGVAILLGLIAFWGVRESVAIAAFITVAEICVLVVIIGFGVPQLDSEIIRNVVQSQTIDISAGIGVLSGAMLAFYAFIGFEDIVNVAEETQDAERNVPRAIVMTLVVTTILYALVSSVAVCLSPITELAASAAPLTFLFERISGLPGETISVIAIFSVLNGALIQIIMASRVFYGLSRRGWLPDWIGAIHRRTQTPANAITLCVVTVAMLSTLFPIEGLARVTSLLTLIIFALVAVALIQLKRKSGNASPGIFTVPFWLPVVSVAMIGFLLVFEGVRRLG
jgi:basic amino acid/polyamine antiporter, APA family